ncbi:MAG: PDZ domain-containing protein, partial [Planctomycetes bacterium]|nr:PDZ domain-containing protein [Planctomycetota bacterium]
MQVAKLDPDVASCLGVPKNQGVLISKVFENTPAFKAGLKDGDVLISIQGKKVRDGQQVQHIVTGLL